MFKQLIGWILALLVLTGSVYSALYVTAIEHRRKESTACWLAGGDGVTTIKFGIHVSYKCKRMHHVLKYRKGVYK